MKHWSIVLFLVILLSLSYSYYNFFATHTIMSVGNVATVSKEDLIEEIEKHAKTLNEAPQEPYIDRVWKKTPGRNGRKVNIKKSYENMKKKNQYDESLVVFDDVKPTKSLNELAPSPIFRGHPEKKMVALLINVSWGNEYIPTILKTLDKHDVKATFFIEGRWAKENADLVRMIDEKNHVIGNHAYSHPNMAIISRTEKVQEIEQTNHILEAIIGYHPKWFAPPSGSYNDSVVQIAHDLQMETILWTVDTIDWKNPSVSVMINRVMGNIHPGATILMHPTESVAQGLENLIDEIKHEKYKIGTIEDLLSTNRS